MKKFVKFRSKKPKRTFNKYFADYTKYKEPLRKDFYKKCGYCDASDYYLGGITCFHIDHFAPKDKFPHRKTDYNNLIYSCSYCNINKGNDWASNKDNISVVNDKGFLDPCDEKYDREFFRDNSGNIHSRTSIGAYMYNRIKFYLKRHSYIWSMTRLNRIMTSLAIKLKTNSTRKLSKRFFELYLEYEKYRKIYLEPEK